MQALTKPPVAVRLLVFAVLVTSGVVFVEPAPTDLLFFGLLGVFVLQPKWLRLHGFGLWIGAGMGMFLFANGLSLMAADNHIAATRYLVITVYMFALFVVMAGWIGRWGLRAAHGLVDAFCLGALLVGAIGILARFQILPNSEAFFLGETALRVKSTFKDPNVFGPYMVAATMLIVGDVLTKRRSLPIGSGYASVYLVSILLAFSRGAFLHLGISLLVYAAAILWLIRSPVLSRRFLIGLGVAGALVILGGAATLALFGLEDFFASRLTIQSYDTERFAMQALTLHVAAENPLGIGPGEWNVDNFPNDPHNVYLRVLAENGILGLLGWLLWCGTVAVGACAGALRRTAASPLYAASFAILVGIFVESLIIDCLHWRHLFFAASLPVGLRIAELHGLVAERDGDADLPEVEGDAIKGSHG